MFDDTSVISRRGLLLTAGGLAIGLPSLSHAQSLRSDVPALNPWQHIPSITIASDANDPRLPAVYEAIDFWNAELLRLGSAFRLGPVEPSTEIVPVHDISAVWGTGSKDTAQRAMPESIRRMDADIIVALSDIRNSFMFRWAAGHKVLVAIQRAQDHPLTVAGGARNVVAHELGHAIGLGHNNDQSTLMCGGVWCHFTIPHEGFLPLTSAEQVRLLEMYPPSWRAIPPRKWKGDPPPALSAG